MISVATRKYRAIGTRSLSELGSRFGLSACTVRELRLLAYVFPFRVNDYVLENLIDWSDVPDDPMFQLTFPQPGMLPPTDMDLLAAVEQSPRELARVVSAIRARLNPHPSGQREYNVPVLDGEKLPGLQHKYAETVLYFPSQGQTCHAYCSYCFRWAQFIGDPAMKFSTADPSVATRYLRRRPEVTDVLITGGDPMIMSAEVLRGHLEALLSVPTVQTIRIGTKSLAYWPYRFTADNDADELLRALELVPRTGRQLAIMVHASHVRELEAHLSRVAVGRLQSAGAQLFCQAPLVARVNDNAAIWEQLWRTAMRMNITPYYLFVERETGPFEYFKVPLARAWLIFREAYSRLPGLARTVRGPVMSATAGKVLVAGADLSSQPPKFDLQFLRAREPELVGRPFTATGPADAAWISELTAAHDTPADLAAAMEAS